MAPRASCRAVVVVVVVVVVVALAVASVVVAHDPLQPQHYTLEHRFGGERAPWSARGTLTVSASRTFAQNSLPKTTYDGAVSPPTLAATDVQSLRTLVAAQPHARYAVRLVVRAGVELLASVAARDLLTRDAAAARSDLLVVHLSAGVPVHLDYRVSSRADAAASDATGTRVRIAEGSRGPQPVVKVQTPEEKKEDQEASKSFLQKYWMYLVPFVILSLLSGGAPEEKEAAGGTGARGAAAARRAPRRA